MQSKKQTSNLVSPHVNPVTTLDDRQRMFCECIMKGMDPQQSARAAGYGYPKRAGYQVLRTKRIKEALKYLNAKHEQVADISRKKVMDGLLESIDMAKLQGDPNTMVNGWREVARICGYYAPETKKLEVSITGKRAIEKMETLSDAELFEMIEQDSLVIEGEAREILDGSDDAQD